MTVLTLRYPVHAMDGRRLLPAGVALTGAVLAEMAAEGRRTAHREISLLEYGTTRRDLAAFMREGSYATILGDEADCAALLALMEKTRFPLPVLESLEYFKHADPYTYRHVLMVFALSSTIARRMMRSVSDVLQEASAGPLHDLGKICVPVEILKKTTFLKRSERLCLEHHTMAGYVLLSYYMGNFGGAAAAVALDHHERGDGSGYPRGTALRGRLVEIVAACDVYDALISPRPYRRKSFDNRTALEEVTRLAEEGKLAWEVVRVLVALNRKDRPPPEECKVSLEKRGQAPEGNLYGVILDDEPAGSTPAR
ncbi:MAG: HD-GYP domain-containing protein [Deltaproteobacteria bacterium]